MQGRIWDRGTGKAGEWEAHTQGTQGEKIENLLLHTCCAFQLGLLLSELRG